jgi:hypothetical protein
VLAAFPKQKALPGPISDDKPLRTALESCALLRCLCSWSFECCKLLCETGNMTKLFGVLAACKGTDPRSQPVAQSILELLLLLVRNQRRNKYLAKAVAHTPRASDDLVNMLQNFRGKGDVLKLALELLELLIRESTTVAKHMKRHFLETLKKMLSIFEKQQHIASLVRTTKKSTAVSSTADSGSAANKLTAIADDLVVEIDMMKSIISLLN